MRTLDTAKEGEKLLVTFWKTYFSLFKLNVISLGSKITAAMKLKDTCSTEEKL